MRLRHTHPGSNGMKDRDMEDTIQELEARVAMLETQKGALQNKLSLAKQHILDLGGRTAYKSNKGNTCVFFCFFPKLYKKGNKSKPLCSFSCQVRVWNWKVESGGQLTLLHHDMDPR